MALQDLPIKRKVTAVIMLTCITVLLLTAVAFMVYDLVSYRREIQKNLDIATRIVAERSSAVLAYNAKDEALSLLATLHADPHVNQAAFFDNAGTIVARFPTNEPESAFPQFKGQLGPEFSAGQLIIFRPVSEKGEQAGILYVRSDLGALKERLRLYAGIALVVLAFSALVALVLSNALQRRISEPILALAQTARVISERRDYSVRAPRTSRDELGLLTDAFNQMLTRIQEQTAALSEGGERLRLALDASQLGTWDWSVTANSVDWDEQTHILFGLMPGTFGGTYEHFLQLVLPEDRAGVSYAINRALEKKTEYQCEFRVKWPDGSTHVLATRGNAIFDSKGDPVRMTGVVLDVTERKQAEEIRSFLAAIIDSTDDAVIGKNLDGRIISWNSGAERMFGFSASEMLGNPIDRIVAPDRPDEEPRILQEVRRGHTQHYETVRIRKDRKPIEVSLTVSPVKDSRGEIIGVSSICRDITERKRAQIELERQATVLREQAQMLDLANVMARDLQDRIILWNTGMEKMYGWSKSEALGRNAHELLQTDFPQPLDRLRASLFDHGHWEGELVHVRKDGQKLTVASQWVLHSDDQGRPVAILEISNDVTERKRAEEQSLLLNAELEQRVQQRTAELTSANRELEAFTYSVAHDLRAPLRHIDAFTKILHEDFSSTLPKEAQRYLENIRNGSRNMSHLVDDLLNLARVGRQELKRQPASLSALVGEVMADLKRETEGRSIEWRIHPLPTVECDAGLMKQVFANLLANAVKYTRPRPLAVVEIGASVHNGDTTIFIRDNGVGFNMKYADKLFGVFQRLHRAEEFEGTGVGLATVERIVRRHGGTVWAESDVNKGATFFFTVHPVPAEVAKV